MSAADLEQSEPVPGDPAGELAQIEGVGLAGQSGVAGQEPAEGDGFGIGEQLTGTDQYRGRIGHDNASRDESVGSSPTRHHLSARGKSCGSAKRGADRRDRDLATF